MEHKYVHSEGPAKAAVLAAGIGSAMLGLLTTLTAASVTVKESLNWWPPAGPLVGKTSMAVLVWLLSWGLLHRMWRQTLPSCGAKIWFVSFVLVALGFLGTFPLFFELFAAHP